MCPDERPNCHRPPVLIVHDALLASLASRLNSGNILHSMLRFHLPPNFAASVSRNAVPLRVEVDVNAAPSPELLPALALLQRWSGAATPPKFIQLSRAQLRELAAAAGSQPIFIENGRPMSWQHHALIASSDPRPAAQ